MLRHIRDTSQDEFADMQTRMDVQEQELDVFREVIDEIRDVFGFDWSIRVADIPRLARERMRALVQEKV